MAIISNGNFSRQNYKFWFVGQCPSLMIDFSEERTKTAKDGVATQEVYINIHINTLDKDHIDQVTID